ncbi:unnamed protein product [Haemonchus placei]|uniref:Transporter n=1 Tax=Haemonchus placei TaxID=6290 RepID=A0A0N4XAA8_HAEPC|nr:unnamed protein product [Haemonchus placei]
MTEQSTADNAKTPEETNLVQSVEAEKAAPPSIPKKEKILSVKVHLKNPTVFTIGYRSAFLFPYFICAVFFGLPSLYLEMLVGQYMNCGPSMLFRHYLPALQVYLYFFVSESASQSLVGNKGRGNWGSQMEFLLATIGLTVGLGNVWRFPALAYNNGGSAFLFPYFICAVFFGLPSLYLEMLVGQYMNCGPSMLFRHYLPALQGSITSMLCQDLVPVFIEPYSATIPFLSRAHNLLPIGPRYSSFSNEFSYFVGLGWSMTLISLTVSIYYCVIIAWGFLYLYSAATGQMPTWGSCYNSWNDIYCTDEELMKECARKDPYHPIAFNGSCIAMVFKEMKTPFDQYFT